MQLRFWLVLFVRGSGHAICLLSVCR